MQLDGAEKGFIYLRTKPTARLNYSFVPPLTKRLKQPLSLLVFLSGVDSKCTAWHYTIVKLREIAKDQNFPLPPMLLYDRYGAGSSDRDPADASRPHNERHDVKEAMFDLQQLIGQIAEQKLDCDEDHPNQLHVIFVGHSMGCCIARLYAAEFPGSVEALLLIDSAISNKAFGDLIPDPDNPTTFSKHTLPADITPEMCRETIRKIRGSPFDFKGGRNSEGIRWDNLPQHLPFSDAPRLRGPMKGLPLVTVICGEPVLLSQVTSKVRTSSLAKM